MTLELDLNYSNTKSYAKFQLNMSKHVREKCRKLCIFSILSSKRGITPTKIDNTQTWSKVQLNKLICKISAQYVKACKRKLRKTDYFQFFKFEKGHNSYKNWRKLTTLELVLKYSTTKSYAKFQLNMLKHEGENCGKLYFHFFKFQKRHNSYKNKRKLTALELDRMFIRRKWHAKFQLNMSKHVGEKCGKLWLTDGRTDRHHHTIIRPVWRRAYKNEKDTWLSWKRTNGI